MKKASHNAGESAPIYDPAKIEKKWQKKWAKDKLYRSKEGLKKPQDKKEKFFVLDMFPYPSGEGLHVGHPKGYIATDIISRMNRMQGKSVLHPMGFDAFGLPAENYAIKTKTNPADAVAKNVARYKEQLELLGADYDWSREINTTDPAYYKWTQWIFLQLYKKGLAFESYEPINWCPVDKTGLANEDIENGRCERCGAIVEKRPMRQWVLKITDYADRLLNDLDIKVESKVPLFIRTEGPDAVRKDMPLVERYPIVCIVKHSKEDKYLGLKWKANPWQGFVTGGVENGESREQAAIREIQEETGYQNIKFIKEIGKIDSQFYQAIKKVNRFAHFTIVYLELIDDAHNEVSEAEKKLHDVVWVSKSEMDSFITHDDVQYVWDLFVGREKQESKPLLDWPNSIKELQKNWIGKSEGAEIEFEIVSKKNKTKFIILHGYTSAPHKVFIPWLKKELEDRGHVVEVPELPNTSSPSESEQVGHFIEKYSVDENTVIIGHSLGCVVAIKALMKLNKRIGGLVLVAPAMEPHMRTGINKKNYHDTFKWDYDFNHIKKLTSGKIAILSDVQEDFRVDYLKFLAKSFSANLIHVKAAKEHFREKFEPEVLKAVTLSVKVFTTRPDTLYGVTYVVLAPEHTLVSEFLAHVENKKEVEAYIAQAKLETEIERTDAKKEKTGVELKGIKVINPANNEEVPVWIADYVLADYGTGAVMAVPAHDDRDFAFAKKFGLEIKHVVVLQRKATTSDIAFRENEPVIKRNVIRAVVKHWSEDKYLVLNWNAHGWKTFISGGIENGENPVEAAKREVLEETGYKNLEFLSNIGSPINALFYTPHKSQNRSDLQQGLLFKLKDNSQDEVSKDEQKIHLVEWVPVSEAEKIFNPTLVDQILLKRINENDLGAFTEEGILINSGNFNGKSSDSIRKDITLSVGGKWVTKYKLRDWVFSRQRYWGEPIPLIHCDKCGVIAVPEKDLPVKLPKVASYEPTGTGESPLAAIHKWVNVPCPKCKKPAKRETNTMPQWAGSSWYYLRYMDPKNKKALVDHVKEKYWAPVDLYVGGAEHATRHLIYARFWHKFLYDIGVVSTIEPFIKLQHVGLIMGEDGRKMSKRFGNVVNPDEVVKNYGADSLRLYEMFMGPFDQQIAWSTSSIVGVRRFIEKVWKMREKVSSDKSQVTSKDNLQLATLNLKLNAVLHKAIKKVTADISAMSFNTAISTLMIAVNELEKMTNEASENKQTISRSQFEILLKLIAPFAPHVAEELWYSLGNKKSIHISEWPVYDEALTLEDEANIIVQVNGKVRASFKASKTLNEAELEAQAKAIPEVQKWLEGKSIKKVIVVKGKLVSIVVA